MRYPIYIFKVGTYHINFLSRPMTEEEMLREMPLVKYCVILSLALLALSAWLLMSLRSMLVQWLWQEA